MNVQQLVLAGAIIFLAHLVSITTGFGGNVFGLPLLALLVGMAAGTQALVVLGTTLYFVLSIRSWKDVDRHQLSRIMIIAGIGLILGMIIYASLPARASMILLGIFVLACGVRGIFMGERRVHLPEWLTSSLLFLGGVVHGAFTIGGPLIVVYANQEIPKKANFRATLSVMWAVLGFTLMIWWTIGHKWDPSTMHVSMIGLPSLGLAMLAGEPLHEAMSPRTFAKFVSCTLVLIGVVLLMRCWH